MPMINLHTEHHAQQALAMLPEPHKSRLRIMVADFEDEEWRALESFLSALGDSASAKLLKLANVSDVGESEFGQLRLQVTAMQGLVLGIYGVFREFRHPSPTVNHDGEGNSAANSNYT